MESASPYSTLIAPHCPNTGPRPGWLLSKWHCDQDHRLDQRYGLRCEDYWRLYELQEGRCALCGFGPRRWRMTVHHNHVTGTIDALLHSPCNRIIDPLLWLLPRLVRLLVDPPGQALGLVVPPAKLRRLEARDEAKRKRDAERRQPRPTPTSNGSGNYRENMQAARREQERQERVALSERSKT